VPLCALKGIRVFHFDGCAALFDMSVASPARYAPTVAPRRHGAREISRRCPRRRDRPKKDWPNRSKSMHDPAVLKRDRHVLRLMAPRLAAHDPRIAKPPPKVADPHYRTQAHRDWSVGVIQRAAGRCEDPACHTPRRIGTRLFADHVVELADGGAPFELSNGMALCGACHSRKTAIARADRQRRPT
jgi:5-methylcytosine-specific restriction protein A